MSGVIGIDIGGTAIKMGLVSLEGIILAKKSLPFDPTIPFPELINTVSSSLKDLATSSVTPVAALGIATPGFCGPGHGNPDRRNPECPRLKGPLFAEGIFRTLSHPVLY